MERYTSKKTIAIMAFAFLLSGHAANADCRSIYKNAISRLSDGESADIAAFKSADKFYRSTKWDGTKVIAGDMLGHTLVGAGAGAVVGGISGLVGGVWTGPGAGVTGAAGAAGGATVGGVMGFFSGITASASDLDTHTGRLNEYVSTTQDELERNRKRIDEYLTDVKIGDDLLREVFNQNGQGTVLDQTFINVPPDQRDRVIQLIRTANDTNLLCKPDGTVAPGSVIKQFVLDQLKEKQVWAGEVCTNSSKGSLATAPYLDFGDEPASNAKSEMADLQLNQGRE